MELDSGSSKEGGSLMQPLVDFESRWETHPSLPPREPEERPEGPWMPGTPMKPWMPMDMDSLWKKHSSVPPEEPSEGPWMPGTPKKTNPWMPVDMDMDSLWKNHPSIPPRFAAALGRTGIEKEMSHDSENVSPLHNNDNIEIGVGDSGKVDCENGGQMLDESLILEELDYGSSNKSSETWGASPVMISFTELLGLAEPLPLPYLPLFLDSQEATMSNGK